ncbi:MAG: hypothetical protein H6739_28835 [Alphaproteobacteria bacterium]|nr:hypothetical protein [Alphaproteobacteria bacterium]
MIILLIHLGLACADPEPCDTLCESAGFDSVEETGDASGLTCLCSGGEGLGGLVTEDDCATYCAAVGSGADSAEVLNTNGSDDTCFCSSD